MVLIKKIYHKNRFSQQFLSRGKRRCVKKIPIYNVFNQIKVIEKKVFINNSYSQFH